MASIENHPFVLLIHEIKISPRPDPEARDPAQREWSSPPTYEPPTNLRTWTVILLLRNQLYSIAEVTFTKF